MPLTLFNFQRQFVTSVLFADIRLIMTPRLIMFGFSQRKIVEGLTAGAVKV